MRRLIATLATASLVLSMVPTAALAKARVTKPGAPGAAPDTGHLVLICVVDGAEYVIDESDPAAIRGTTPVQSPIRLRAGAHTIRVSREGYLPFSEVFDITGGETSEVEVDLVLYSGTLKVQASPEGVQVQVDGTVLGTAPIDAKVSIGEHVVRLSRPGFVEEVRRANVKTSQTTELSVRLIPEAEAEKAAGKSAFYKQWWFWTIVGTVVAGAVATGVAVPMTQNRSHPAEADAQVQLP